MSRWLLGLMAGVTLTATALSPALADERRHGHDRGLRGHDIRRFHDRDFGRWQHGRWFEGRHRERSGWWWIVGPTWYYYPAPIYPYPDPYVPPAVAPTSGVWYYCRPLRAYYPYVPSCPTPWQVVAR